MNKLRVVMMWCLLLGIMVSCGSKDDSASPTETAELDYQPTTQGSTWSYGGASPYTVTVTGKTKAFDGKPYAEMETKQGSNTRNSYVLKENGEYTVIGMDPNLGDIALIFLKEAVAAGNSWSQNNVINGIQTKMTFTVVAKGMTKTVEGKTFSEVIHVQARTSVTFMGVEVDAGVTTNYFWAKGVGLILTDMGQMGTFPLMTYSIR